MLIRIVLADAYELRFCNALRPLVAGFSLGEFGFEADFVELANVDCATLNLSNGLRPNMSLAPVQRRSTAKNRTQAALHDETVRASSSQFAHRQRLNLRASRHRSRSSAYADKTLGDDVEFNGQATAEMTAPRELAHFLDAPIHELEGLAASGSLWAHQLRIKGYEVAKRGVDIFLSLAVLLAVTPLLAIVAAIVKLTDGGPVLYSHMRVGLNGNEFRCLKFRSMVPNADSIKADIDDLNFHSDSRTFKVPNDPRVTRFGRLMRKLSIDELPQLWNVLIGDMSFVGPRPPVPSEVEQYTLDDMERLTVKPGLTCIWQVSGRSRISFPEQLQMDLDYIDNRSLFLDFKLLALTVPAVLSGDGAY